MLLCFVLFAHSFWRHPFTAEVRKWCNAKFLQICYANSMSIPHSFSFIHIKLNMASTSNKVHQALMSLVSYTLKSKSVSAVYLSIFPIQKKEQQDMILEKKLLWENCYVLNNVGPACNLVYMALPHFTSRQRSDQLRKGGTMSGFISKSTCPPLCFDLTAPIIALP